MAGSLPSPTVGSGGGGLPPLSHGRIRWRRSPFPLPWLDPAAAGSLLSPTAASSCGGLPPLSHGWIRLRWAPFSLPRRDRRLRTPSPLPLWDPVAAGSLPTPTAESNGGRLLPISHGGIRWRRAPFPLPRRQRMGRAPPARIELPHGGSSSPSGRASGSSSHVATAARGPDPGPCLIRVAGCFFVF